MSENEDRRECPDGGRCHHLCAEACFRVLCCAPLSAAHHPGDAWPAELRAQHRAADDRERATRRPSAALESPEPVAPGSVLERMLAAGMDEANARAAIAAGMVRLNMDSAPVTDPTTPAPHPTAIAILPWGRPS